MGCVSSSEVKSTDVNNSDDESPIIKTVTEVSESPLTDLDIKQSVSVSLTSPTPDIDSESINLGKIQLYLLLLYVVYL